MEKVSKLIGQYNDLKRKRLPNFRFNPEKGTMPFGKKKHSYLNVFHDFDFEFDWYYVGEDQNSSSLHLVQIYFDTATFDEIERDKKIKFEGQLSLIGGTMGLLTGFSIISGIELFLFLIKVFASLRTNRYEIVSAVQKKFPNHLKWKLEWFCRCTVWMPSQHCHF